MSKDLGPVMLGLNREQSGHFPLGTLRVGPTPTTVELTDNHDNDQQGQSWAEVVYVNELIIDAGATLHTNGRIIYYLALSNSGTVTNMADLVPIQNSIADLNGDGCVNWGDFSVFAGHWLDSPCTAPDWCGGTDLDGSGTVDWGDFSIFAGHWLEGC